jgi:riboflavin kinase/FMN adenylyltransferase
MMTQTNYEISWDEAVIAIGNFDGIHKGHQYLLFEAKKIAQAKNMPLVVLSFEPHPRRFFAPETESFRIAPEDIKREKLLASSVDHVVFWPFNQTLANMKAEDFVQEILLEKLKAAHIVVGEGFHFGYRRQGNAAVIREKGINVTEVEPLQDSTGAIISSTRVREALKAANISGANKLLGWEWEIRGEVVHGDKRGRELGYPTANIWLETTICPSYGVYAVQAARPSAPNDWIAGAANIGIRPMFETRMPLLEVFLFNFKDDLYGETLSVRPIQKIRDEAKFDSLDELIKQMEKDCIKAKEIIAAK